MVDEGGVAVVGSDISILAEIEEEIQMAKDKASSNEGFSSLAAATLAPAPMEATVSVSVPKGTNWDLKPP